MSGRRLVLALCAVALAGVLPPMLLGAAQGPPSQATFQVNISGDGSGTVSGPDGTCSYNGSVKTGDCSGSHPVGGMNSDLVYTATASPGSVFNNWFGPCESEVGTTCGVDRQDPELAGQTVIITAVFLSQGPTLTVTESIGGRVTSTPAGVACGDGATDCTETFALNTQVRLTATPAAGHVFVRWEGSCATFTTNICDLLMNTAKTARAIFAQGAATFPLTVTPPVGGDVASSPAGILCGAGATDCTENFAANAQVQLTATPMAGYAFVRWEGDCATVEILVCVVTIDNATTVAVVFVQVTPKCRCKDLTVTAPKREFGSAEGIRPGLTLTRFFFSIDWNLRCTAGTGQTCKGTLIFEKPGGFKNVKTWRLVKVGNKTKRVPDDSPITCQRACKLNQSTITNGKVRVNMDSNKTFDQLEGKSFEFKVTTKCSGEETTYVFTVSMGANGRIKEIKRSIEV